jgi:hypothetical protein
LGCAYKSWNPKIDENDQYIATEREEKKCSAHTANYDISIFLFDERSMNFGIKPSSITQCPSISLGMTTSDHLEMHQL